LFQSLFECRFSSLDPTIICDSRSFAAIASFSAAKQGIWKPESFQRFLCLLVTFRRQISRTLHGNELQAICGNTARD
jgi:hypothetical protein